MIEKMSVQRPVQKVVSIGCALYNDPGIERKDGNGNAQQEQAQGFPSRLLEPDAAENHQHGRRNHEDRLMKNHVGYTQRYPA